MLIKLMRGGILPVILSVLLFSCETFTEALASISTSLSSLSSSDSGTAGRSDPGRRADPDAANWDIDALDTARDAEYLTGLEKDVVLEMNKARSNPKKYAELYIQPRLRYYSGNNYSEPGQITIVTREGKKAVEDCVAAMSRMQAAPLLTPELGLSLGAKDHTADQGKTGQTGHNGSDRSTPFTRIARYGGGNNRAGENLAYGSGTGQDIIVDLLVDDGVPSRGHRANIMSRHFTQTGVSCGIHPQFRTMCAITYANGYVNK